MRPKVIAVVGPTASGKSALGDFLAQKLRGEVISADSRQIYKGMKVISRAEAGHMVGIADPRRAMSAGAYAALAAKKITMIYHSKKIPIVVGGTGFYAEALLRGGLPEVVPNKKLRASLNKKTPVQLLARLRQLDPKSAARVDPHNTVRLIRAIEVARALGSVPAPQPHGRYKVLWLGLRESRNLRAGVEARLRRGILAEAKKLRGALPRRRYMELGFEFDLLGDYIDKKISKKELIGKIANGERKYAKRQLRWFKRNKDILWVKTKAEALELSKQFLSGR
ncbi:MAG: tRNA (adenosine(37)-N6)-dimethylallyltransferase MiaA [Patescibacteria group bacterium]|nr:tRNA (adenosine(37)-N6)-dimethylallyltransferase MiaA [Patescibacteria group bacterium]